MTEGCVFCDHDRLREAGLYFENEFCIYASTRDPRDPPDVIPGCGGIVPKVHRASLFDLTAEEWAATRELLLLVRTELHKRLAPDSYTLGWNDNGLHPRWRPPPWLLPSALLAGLLVTLLYLANMDYEALPGCGPAGSTMAELPARCFTLAQGYPVRFLSAYQSTPQISQTGLAEDWAQWSLVSFTVLYLAWLLHVRPGPGPRRSPVAEQPSEALN